MTDLIVIGASVRAAVHSAIRAGLACYAIDLFADRDLAACAPAVKIESYPQDFLTALAAAPVAPWIYTGGLENHPRLVARLASLRPLLGNSAATLRAIRDPQQLAPVALAANCPLPPASGPVTLVKPRRGSAGLGIRLATAQDIANPPPGCYLQAFLPGQSASAVFVAAAGRAALFGVTQQWIGSDFALRQAFQYVGSLGPLELTPNEHALLIDLGNRLARQFSLVGLFNIDFVRAGGVLRLLEVNPRYSASIEVLERALGRCAIPLHLAACAGQPLPALPPPPERVYFGKAVVYADHAGVVPPQLAALLADWNKPGQAQLAADLPNLGDALTPQQPVLTVFASGDSLPAVAAQLRDRVQAVQTALRP